MDGKDFGEVWKFVVKLIIILAIFVIIFFATMLLGNKAKTQMTDTSTQTQTVEKKSAPNPTVNVDNNVLNKIN